MLPGGPSVGATSFSTKPHPVLGGVHLAKRIINVLEWDGEAGTRAHVGRGDGAACLHPSGSGCLVGRASTHQLEQGRYDLPLGRYLAP